jgi:hypothetical protein
LTYAGGGALVLALLLLGLTLAYQRAWTAHLNIGFDEAIDNDTPFLRGFHEPELIDGTSTRYRWTTPEAALQFSNLPQRAYLLTLRQINGNPTSVGLANQPGALSATLQSGRILHLLLPVEAAEAQVALKVDQPFAAPGDLRELGAALQGGSLQTLGAAVWPPLLPLLTWAGALLALWLVIGGLGGGLGEALLLAATLAGAAVAATWFAPMRVGYAAGAIFQTTLYGLGFALLARWLFPRLLSLVDGPDRAVDRRLLRWLILAATAVWALKLGGRIVPGSMIGDIGFHRNRVWAQMLGNLFNPSLHRGVPFPYPPALYALIAPLTTSGISPEWLLQLAAAACEALSLPVMFGLVRRISGSERAGLVAAILYGAFPAGFMTVAWSFDSHIFAQFLTLAWSALLIRAWGRWHQRRIWLWITAGLTLIALSHFGFYINTSLLAGLLVLILAVRFGRRGLRFSTQRQWLALTISLIATQLIVWALYYSAFVALFLAQGRSVAEGGVGAVNNRALIPRAALLWDTLNNGFWRHYALIPVLLAPFGLWLLWRERERGRPAALVIGATFVVSLALGGLPIVTGAPLTTRWLMFSAWGLAVCGGVAMDYLWERWGRWGRWATIVSTLFIAAWGIQVWLEAVIYRIRPPEPF